MDGSSDGRNGSAAARGGRLLPAAVFVVMVVVAAVAFATVHSTVNDQNRRALDERTREVGLLLKTAITGLSSSMQPLGVAARFGGTQAFSREAAAHTATAKTQAVALVRRTGGGVLVV